MDAIDLLVDAAQRPAHTADVVLKDLQADAAHAMPEGANSIAWLVWHAARQMDVQTAALSGGAEVWSTGGWAERLGVQKAEGDFGFGDSAEDVAALKVRDVAALGDHLEACTEALVSYIRTLSEDDLDDVVDESYSPPVTRGVRLVSIVDDAVVHLGQAAYARGIVEGWSLGV